MSKKYPGGFITKSPATPTNPIATTPAPGIWTIEQATQLIQAGVWPNPANIPVETVFSTYIYTGNSSTQTITNGIDLAGQGGLVWIKSRSTSGNNIIEDSGQGFGVKYLITNSTAAAAGDGNIVISSTSSTGFTLGNSGANSSGTTYVSWTFREAPKFFDVVTGTADGSGGFSFTHNLGSTPGMVILKNTNSGGGDWLVFHTSTGTSKILYLNQTSAAANIGSPWINVSSTSVSSTGSGWFVGGATYVAYLFAHDTSTYGTIQCGSYTGNSLTSNPVTLGWEPQWVLIKNASLGGTGWVIFDNIRGIATGTGDLYLYPNNTNAEGGSTYSGIDLNPTGFTLTNSTDSEINTSPNNYIYVAIRRGLMAPPTVGTNVFSPNLTTSSGQGATVSTGFPVDLQMSFITSGTSFNAGFVDRLRGINSNNDVGTSSYPKLTSSSDATESNIAVSQGWNNTGFAVSQLLASTSVVYWNFRRAAGFFDEVCYTGTGTNTTINHNLTVVPELMIVKRRNSSTGNWWVYTANLGPTNGLNLNADFSVNTSIASIWNSTAPTASVFSVGTNAQVNASGINYVAYLFATCPGASKVGSYTGNGSSQTIDCGFTTGARFLMIKRTDSTGNWWVWDTARGIVASFDPAAPINTATGQASAADTIDPDNSGFIVNQEATINANVSGGSYIFFAVS